MIILLKNKKAESARIKFLKKIDKQKNRYFLKPRPGSFLSNKNDSFYKKFKILKLQI